MFITFEGLDFSGKSTQVKLLHDYLLKQNCKVKIIREPGGTFISEKIREILLNKNHLEMSLKTELLLFAASRAQLVEEVILPALKYGCHIISDRFHDSSIAYQSFGRELPFEFVSQLQNFVLNDAVPDITFFIDLPVSEITKRKAALTNVELDRIELSQNDFYEKVRDGYLHLAEKDSRIINIDGTKTITEIHNIIISRIEEMEMKKRGSNDS